MEQIHVEEKITAFTSFYEMDLSNGPLVGFYYGTYYPLQRYQGASSLPSGTIRPENLRPADFMADYRRLFELHNSAAGDTIWSGSLFWGIPWMEALAGCSVIADHDTGSSRSVPPQTLPDVRIPRFSGTAPWSSKAAEFLDALTASPPPYPLGTTLMRGFSDILSALYGSPDFVYRLLDGGSEMRKIIEKIADLWIGFADFQLDRFPDFHGGVGSFIYNMWMPGRGAWIQEDASALLSPGLFETWITPAIEKVIDHLDSVIIHLHPSTYIPIDPLLGTGLSAIELHIDRGGPTAEDLLPVYRKIQSRKPLIIWGDLTEEDIRFIRNNLDPASLVVLPVVETYQDAEQIWTILKS